MDPRPGICLLGALLGCASPRAEHPRAALDLIDVSADDCVVSTLVWDRPPAEATEEERGIAFVNDACEGTRIFLGVDGTERELTRVWTAALGYGGPYADDRYRVQVSRGRLVSREEIGRGDDTHCFGDDDAVEYRAIYETKVRIWSDRDAWTIDGWLDENQCVP